MKAVLIKLLHPALPWRIALVLYCAPALLYIFANSLNESPFAYITYVLSAYILTILIISLVKAIKQINAAICKHSLGNKLIKDLPFKGRLSLASATVVNAGYAVLEIANAVVNQSFWYTTIGVYYLLLSVARGVLLHSLITKANHRGQLKAALLCGWLLLGLNVALSLVTSQMVTSAKGYTYAGNLIFVVAFYAFYSVIIAVINLFRFRKLQSPALSASKVISIATALVSMLSLQTAMFASFGATFAYQRLMNGLTGAAVCSMLFFSALLMIINITKKLARINKT